MTILARPSEWVRPVHDATAATPRAGGAPHYFAFLSYSHQDEPTADWLQAEIEQFKVPMRLVGRLTEHGSVPRRLTPVFRDLEELAASQDLSAEIEEALSASRFLIVLCSPAAAASRWTNAEIEFFKRARPDGCILAAIIAGEPFASNMPGREQEECLPRALRFKYDRRGRPTAKPAEPLAADLRGDAEARRTGFLKLVAGLLGVGLDDLVKREEVRRQRRLAILTAASLAGMVITSGLAITAIQARDAARDQRREAEGLVAFMLGDLKDKLEPIGRLDALDGVGSKVLDYYSKQDTSELSDAALLQRARALSLTAQVAYLRGNYGGASSLYRQAVAGTAEAVRRNPDDPQRLFDHAQNVFWIGEMARLRGDLSSAESAYREYGRLAARMSAIEPDNLKWRMEVQYARENLGIVLMSQRRFAEAARQFESALGPIESLASIDKANTTYQLEVSNLLAWLADAQRAQGRFGEAIALRERQVAWIEKLLSGGEANAAIRDDLIPAHRALGLLWTSRGDLGRGVGHFRMALAEADRLIPIEPDNRLWRAWEAGARLDLGANLLGLGHRDEAARETEAGCAAVSRLGTGGSNAAVGQRLRTTCLSRMSELSSASGDSAQALQFADRALDAALRERSGDRIADLYNVAATYRLLGDVRKRRGDSEGAAAAWAAGLAQLQKGAIERPWEMSERAELLRRAGRVAESRPLHEQLAAIGYRNST